MKAIQFVGANRALELHDVPVPAIGRDDVLVKIKAAGICHSDAHYRSGLSLVNPIPLTLGHEVAGIVEKIGAAVSSVQAGDRVCLHYNITCGRCDQCVRGNEQFCESVRMIGHHADGGYAEYIAVPARNALIFPGSLPFEQAATLMCASATAFHALKKSRLKAGESIAIFGAGGLGQSAVQLAKSFGAQKVFAVDINAQKLGLAAQYGAIAVDASTLDPVAELRRLTENRGVDVAIEMIGLRKTMHQALLTLGVLGRLVIVGLSREPLAIDTYREILGSENEIIGSNDHHRDELETLIDLAARKILDTSQIVTRTIALDPEEINDVLDELQSFGSGVRTVIVP